MLAARRGALWKRAVAAGGLLVAVAGVELTFSRSGFLAMAAGAAVVCLLRYRPAWRGFAVFVACLAALLAVSPRTYLARIAPVIHPLQDSSVRSRLSIWRQAGERARRDILVGRGPGTFESSQVDRPVEKRRSSHNVLIEILTDMGVVGLAAFLWVLLATFRRLAILRRAAERSGAVDLAAAVIGVGAALGAYLTASMALSSPFQSPPFVLIGLSIALERIAAEKDVAPVR
jgi:putative inorganic carbon (hco3(-)) transporter